MTHTRKSTVTLALSGDSTARGRNGWFIPRTATRRDHPDGTRYEVWSAQQGDAAPVVLVLSDTDAAALASLLAE